jgi:uncharacterized protein
MVDRMCIVTREVLPEEALIRFVQAPDGAVTPDLNRKLPGRGVWVGASQAKVAEAIKRNLFSKGFGGKVAADPDLPAILGRQLRRQAVALLSLTRKAGQAVYGFMKVEDAMKKGPVRLLIHAPDSGTDGVKKLDRLAQPETLITHAFTAEELNLAFGQSNVIHAAIAAGPLAEKLRLHIDRMVRYSDEMANAFVARKGLEDEAI